MLKKGLWLCLALAPSALAEAPARVPVLQQIALPHSYYWREMYLPQLTTGPSQLAFTPDGQALIYSMAGSLWRQPLDADRAQQLSASGGYDFQPDVSPDGRYVIFSRQQNDSLELWRLDLQTHTETQLTQTGATNLEPRISPDGQQLVFVSTRDTGHFNLYLGRLSDAGLTDIEPLVAPRESEIERYYYDRADHAINPSWSPDGERVFFVGNREVAWGSGDLWSVQVKQPEQRKRIRVEETTWATHPELSPDGKRLLYASYQGRQWHQLWLTTPTGQNPLPLTFGDFDRRQQRWSPDGQRIAYISNESGHNSLWLQDVVGGAKRQIIASERDFLTPMTRLKLTLKDARGRSIAGRVMVEDTQGRHYGAQPDAANDGWVHADDGFIKGRQQSENHYFHCQKSCQLWVPQGELNITALHGFAAQPALSKVQVKGDQDSVSLRLGDLSLPAKFGPFTSADVHVHMNYGGAYQQQLQGLAQQMAAEDLDVAYNLIVNKEQRIPDIKQFSTQPYRTDKATIFQGQEYHTSYWGHLGLLHLDDHYLTPDFSSYQHTALASPYPHNGTISDLAHAQGALVGYVHPFDWDIDPAQEARLSHSLPADVALGKTDYLEVVSFADHKATAGVWYKLLNLGYHLPAAAGTDAMTNYASLRGPVGLNRVYLATARDTPAALKQALKSGHSFVTNGPLLGLKVNGQGPGAQIALAAPGTVKVEAALRSLAPMSDLELVFNGQVIRRLQAGTRVDFSEDVAIPGSGWLLLRSTGPAHPWVQDIYPYASTNPVWIDIAGSTPNADADARYFVAWLDRVIDSVSARTDFNTDTERTQTLTYLHAARAQFAAKMRDTSL